MHHFGSIFMFRHLAVLALFATLPSLCCADKANEKAVTAQTLASFEQQAATVRDCMQSGGVYGYMKDPDKARVEQRLGDMRNLLERHPGQDLSKDEKVALLNAQEDLNALLLQNDNNRLICDRSAHTGSRIHVTTCVIYGELMHRQQQDQQTLGDIQRQPQTQMGIKRDGG
jgi:hypothetical protein